MNSRYVIGITITLILLSINQVFIQYWLAQKKYDANTINIAGKQRMLSQRINAEFYRIQQEEGFTDSLKELIEQWQLAHSQLLCATDMTKTTKISDPTICQALEELTPNIEFIKSQFDNIKDDKLNLHLITQKQNYFLANMDQIVRALEEGSDKKLQLIIRIEYSLFFVSLIILILEVIYIYVPIERSLKNANKEISNKNHKIKKALNDIKRKNKELEQITYITSHDLQEPVRTINSLVNLLKIKHTKALDEEGSKILNFIDGATLRMRDLIKDLLEYSVLGKEKEKTKIDCSRLLDEVTDDLSLKIKDTNTKIRWTSMPKIIGTKAEIRLLFQNLISNAIKFQSKHNEPKIDITAVEKEETWLFSVSDNGIGIEPEHLDKIFSIFHRIHSKEKFAGTGIGLAHCAKIIDIHGGEIWVESKPDKGSTFFFTIKKLPNNTVKHEKESELYSIS